MSNEYKCPTCGAVDSEKCLSATGNKLYGYFHKGRYAVVEAAYEQQPKRVPVQDKKPTEYTTVKNTPDLFAVTLEVVAECSSTDLKEGLDEACSALAAYGVVAVLSQARLDMKYADAAQVLKNRVDPESGYVW